MNTVDHYKLFVIQVDYCTENIGAKVFELCKTVLNSIYYDRFKNKLISLGSITLQVLYKNLSPKVYISQNLKEEIFKILTQFNLLEEMISQKR